MSALFTLFRGLARALDGVRKVLHFVALMFFFVLLAAGLSGPGAPRVQSGALLVDPKGPLVEELAGDPVERALASARGVGAPQTLLRELTGSIRLAAQDEKIKVIVLDVGLLGGAGLPKLQAVALALDEFRATGKKVYVYGDYFLQGQYYLAAHADEVYLNPTGLLFLEGYGRYRQYYAEAIEKLSIDWNVFKVGEFKSFVEPYIRDDMSTEDKASSAVWLGQLWDTWQADVIAARELEADAIARYTREFVVNVEAAGGQMALVAEQFKLVDGLMTRDEFRSHMAAIVGEGELTGSFRSSSLRDYATVHAGKLGYGGRGDAVAVIVASGDILDGEQPPGSIGGDTLSGLIRQARGDKSLKALVLRIDSGGGSKFASEVIQRELKLWKASGRPLVASMSSVAASGGYFIAMDADEIWANPTTITGSIGIGGYIPTFQRTLDRLGVHTDGIGTTGWAGSLRIDRALGDDARRLLQAGMEFGYRDFVTRVAEGRDMNFAAVDDIARGRVWSGSDAQQRGLVDRMGGLQEALNSAASLAGLGEGYPVRYVMKSPTFTEQLALMFATRAAAWTGEGAPLERRPATWQRVLMALDSGGVERHFNRLLGFNDPTNLYYHCLCGPD